MCVPYEELSNYIKSEDVKDWEQTELKETIENFLEELPKAQRQVFMLRYWYFMSVKEIMQCCNMSKSRVEPILFRTRNKLKNYLKERSYL